MSTYAAAAFKGYWGSSTGPFNNTLAASVSGLTLQQAMNDIADSCLFKDTYQNTDINYFESNDWLGNIITGGWTGINTGAGASAGISSYGEDTTERAQGIAAVDPGTTAAGTACIYRGSFKFGLGHSMRYRKRCAVNILGNVTDNYRSFMGYFDTNAAGEPTNGAYFRYNYNVNSGKVQAVTRSGGVETATDTGVTMDSQYHIYEIRVNSTGTSIDFYIDGANLKTNITNIPTASLFQALKQDKLAGTNTRPLYEDYYDYTMNLASTR
jgi:hypothetical protein